MENLVRFKLVFCSVVFILIRYAVSAQDVNDPYRARINPVFANLNRAQITTGYLSEYATPLMPLENFNGGVSAGNVTNRSVWQQLYATWFTSYIATTTNPNPTPAAVQAAIENAATGTSIPIALLYGSFASLRSNAVSSNLLYVSNDRLYDVAGRTQSPYLTNALFAAAPARNYIDSNRVSFVFNAGLRYGNNTSPLSGIAIDFGDGGGYQAVALGVPAMHTYGATGTKRVRVRLTPTAGPVVESHFDFEVRRITVCANCRFGDQPVFPANCAACVASPNHAGGRVSFTLSVNNPTGRLRRPLIVAEGYDISSVAPLLQDNFTIRNFIRMIEPANQGGANAGTFDFNEALDDLAGYDLVFVDYNNGTDDIRRNAALLQDVIRWVNAEKAANGSIEQNVVLGLSMGGLVARFGLAQMVRNNEATGTRLLITMDSPHLGANTPLGIQFAALAAASINFTSVVGGRTIFAFNARTALPQLDQFVNLSNAAATNQLLVVRATNATGGVAGNTFLANEYRNMIDLATPYRTVAVSNGSQCGTPLFAPGTELASFNASGFFSPVPWISNNRLRTELVINSLASQQSNRLLGFRVYSSWRILSLITINVTLFERNIDGPATLPYDGIPGGTQLLRGQLPGNIASSNGIRFAWFFEAGYSFSLRDNFSFVSVPSALDITNYTLPSTAARYVNGVSPENISRFPTFVAQETFIPPGATNASFNEEHIRFTARNSRWIFNEMQNITNGVHCTAECAVPELRISGGFTQANCTATSATYFVSTTAPGAVYNWTVPSGFTITAGQGTSSLTVTRTSSCGGCTLSVLVANGCGNLTASTLVKGTGYSSSDYPVTGPFSGNCNQELYYSTGELPGAITYTWFWPSNWTYVSGQGSRYLAVRAGTTSGAVGVRVSTACDAGGSAATQFTNISCSSGFSIYPNPASSEVTVEKNAPAQPVNLQSPADTGENTLVEILDRTLQTVVSGRIRGGKVKLSVQKLPPGLYFVRITEDGLPPVTEQLQILR